jgi:hypothetical protein
MNSSKSTDNCNKFIANSKRLIELTKTILSEILRERPELAEEYSKLPDILTFAETMLSAEDQNKVICGFIDKSYVYWDKIIDKDFTILTEHLDIIFPKNEYVSKIQYLYINKYVNESRLNVLWKLLLAFIHNSVKYIYFSKNPKYYRKIIEDGIIEKYSINLEV